MNESFRRVIGIVQRDDSDDLAIKVYVDNKTKALQEKLPKELDGHPAQIEVSGEFHAQQKKPSSRAGAGQ
jgi:hypothetical protein